MYIICSKAKQDYQWSALINKRTNKILKCRSLDKALSYFKSYVNAYPERMWSIRDLKTNDSLYNNVMDMLVKWRVIQ